jgi:hypothetical protein
MGNINELTVQHSNSYKRVFFIHVMLQCRHKTNIDYAALQGRVGQPCQAWRHHPGNADVKVGLLLPNGEAHPPGYESAKETRYCKIGVQYHRKGSS